MMHIIPAMDLLDGRCVRLEQGDPERSTIYSDDPVAIARSFADAGVRRLHVVDLDGALRGRPCHLELLGRIAEDGRLRIDHSGGIRTSADLEAVFDAGASMVALGSMAVHAPATVLDWVSRFGAERFLLGADVRDEHIATHGWRTDTGIHLHSFLAPFVEAGLTSVFCTDIAKDGMSQGPSVALYERTLAAFPGLDLIASGGIGSLEDLTGLAAIGCRGAIIGRAIYDGTLALETLRPWLD